VLELRRDDLDLEAGLLRIRPELGKTRAEKRGRIVPVSHHLLAMVPGWPEDPDGWLVHVPPHARRGEDGPGRYEGAPKRRAWNAQLSGAWLRAGVRPEVWDTQPSEDGRRHNGHPAHAFRRGFITGLQVLGAPIEDVQYLVGHQQAAAGAARGNVTTERYTDPSAVHTTIRVKTPAAVLP
jgi:integrase